MPQLYRPGELARPGPPSRRLELETEDAGGLSLERYLGILLRRKWALLAVAATVVALAALDVYTTTYVYRASARLQIDPEELNVLPYQDIADAGGYISYQYQLTQLEKIRSHELATRVAESLNLPERREFYAPAQVGVVTRFKGELRILPARLLAWVGGLSRLRSGGSEQQRETTAAERQSRDELRADPVVSRLRGGIGARLIGETRLIEVSYTSPIPEFAAVVANAVAEEFVRLHLESRFGATNRATEFLESELEELKIKVERSEEELLRYAREKNIVAIGERETLIRKKLADLTDQLTQAEAEMISQRALLRAVDNAGPGQTPDILKDERTRGIESRLSQLEGELAGLSGRYGPKWPEVQDLRRKIEEHQSQLEEGRRRAVASARQSYEVVRNRYDQLVAAVEEQKAIVEQLDNDSIQYNILKREADTNQNLYEGLLQRLKEAGVAAGLESSNIQVAERAFRPGGPSYPQRMKTLRRSVIMGLLLGLVAVFVLEGLDKTVKTAEDIQQYAGLPSLGVIPAFEAEAGRPSKRGLRRRNGRDPRPILAMNGHDPGGGDWEAYRSLRTSLLLSHSEPPQTILVTSAGPEEGKTTTAANLAASFAQTGARTLLMDLDLRRPTLASSFGLPEEEGMSTYLSGNSDLSSQILKTRFKDLFLVPAGPPPPNPPELIGSDRMATGLDLLCDYFTYVVLDSPPALALSDAFIVSSYLDGVVVVARAGKTPKQALRKVGDGFARIGSTVFGVVLNGARLKTSEYGYYYGYGAENYRRRADEDSRLESG